MPQQKQVDMEYKLTDKDYVDLWKYFQDKATSIKGAMFNTITWIIGFAAALLGFVFAKLADFDSSKAAIPLPMLMISISIAGMVICLFAFFALNESAKHIQDNWGYADNCKQNIEALRNIVGAKEAEKKEKEAENKKKFMKIWYQLAIVVGLFLVAFIVITAFAPQIERLKLNADAKIRENLDTTRSAAQRATDAANAAGTALALIEENRKRVDALVANLEQRMQKAEQTTPKPEQTTPKPTTKQSNLSPGQWEKIQRSLTARGFYQGPLDGQAGPITVNAIREYQKWRSEHPEVTGTLDDNQVDDLLK
jgi:hypothetical protein